MTPQQPKVRLIFQPPFLTEYGLCVDKRMALPITVSFACIVLSIVLFFYRIAVSCAVARYLTLSVGISRAVQKQARKKKPRYRHHRHECHECHECHAIYVNAGKTFNNRPVKEYEVQGTLILLPCVTQCTFSSRINPCPFHPMSSLLQSDQVVSAL